MKYLNWILLIITLGISAIARAQTPIWIQGWDNQATVPYSSKLSDGSIDQEIADDFDLIGRVDSVFVSGGYITYFNSPPMVLQGATVRFYSSANGVPGTLQYEEFVPASKILVDSDSVGNFSMRFNLPTAFTATGKHFMSVQTLADMPWSRNSSNTGMANGEFMMIRDRRANGPWTVARQSDATFVLYGVVQGPPRVDLVSSSTVTRSGRIRIFGTNFGEVRGTGSVQIGGIPAIVTRWSSTLIHAYVPESATLGTNELTVTTSQGTSAAVPLTVTARTSPGGRALWRFQVDGYATGDVIVGPDGTIYTTDGVGAIYALTPDGGLKWITPASVYGSRLTQGSDGTLYVMGDGRMTAVRADGTVKWIYAPADLNWTLSGPTVGPDGNIYAVDQHMHGFFSVTPDGQLRWRNPKVGDRTPRGHHIVFGAGQAYINHTHLDFPALELQAYGMADGQLKWIRDAHRDYQPLIGLGGRIYVEDLMGVWYSVIYNPDGSEFLRREGSIGQRSLSPDLSKIYNQGFQSTAFNALNALNFGVIWTYIDSALVLSGPTPDPLDRILLAKSQPNYGTNMSLLAISTAGQFLWRETLPAEKTGYIHLTTGPAFSLDSNTAYFGTVIPEYSTTDEYSYVYAFGLSFGATSQLSSLSLNPEQVTAGSTSTGTVRLTGAAPAGGATVTLRSDNSVAAVPASVTVPAGATSATFTISTSAVSFTQGALIHATYNGVVKSANLLISPASTNDVVTITKAEYVNRRLTVEATCSRSTSTLRVYNTATNALIGKLNRQKSGLYTGRFTMNNPPQSVTVRSTGGGSDTRVVTFP